MAQPLIGITFHGIGTPRRTLEPGEAPYWISTPRFEAILDRIAAQPDPSRFRISFDDGNLSDLDVALPRLIARNLSADVFVLAGRIGQTGSLSAADIRALAAACQRIGSHGIHHRDWRRIPPAELHAELTQSRAALAAITGAPITTASIPFGSYNGRVLTALKSAGYSAAYSSDRGAMTDTAYLRPRTSVRDDTDDAALTQILHGRLSAQTALRRAAGMAHRRLSRG